MFMDNNRSIWPNWKNEQPYAALTLGLLFMAFLFLLTSVMTNLQSLSYLGKAPATPNTITITGDGKVTGVPDIATVDLGMLTTSSKVSEAQSANVSKMNELTVRLKNLGISSQDLKTTQYNISPRYDYRAGRSVLAGYDVQQTLNAKVRDLEKLSLVLQAAADVGANQIGGLSFTIDDPEALRAVARLKAISNARAKAAALAGAIGVKLGPVVSFSEAEDNERPPIPYTYAREGLGGAAPAPSVESGSLDIVSTVTLSYELR